LLQNCQNWLADLLAALAGCVGRAGWIGLVHAIVALVWLQLAAGGHMMQGLAPSGA
jgi:hypothetical protein